MNSFLPHLALIKCSPIDGVASIRIFALCRHAISRVWLHFSTHHLMQRGRNHLNNAMAGIERRPPAQQASALSTTPLPLCHELNFSRGTDQRKEKKQHLSLIFVFTTSLAEESGKTRIFLHISYLNSFFRIIRLFTDFKTKGYFFDKCVDDLFGSSRN